MHETDAPEPMDDTSQAGDEELDALDEDLASVAAALEALDRDELDEAEVTVAALSSAGEVPGPGPAPPSGDDVGGDDIGGDDIT